MDDKLTRRLGICGIVVLIALTGCGRNNSQTSNGEEVAPMTKIHISEISSTQTSDDKLHDANDNAIRTIQDGESVKTHDGITVERTGDTVTFH